MQFVVHSTTTALGTIQFSYFLCSHFFFLFYILLCCIVFGHIASLPFDGLFRLHSGQTKYTIFRFFFSSLIPPWWSERKPFGRVRLLRLPRCLFINYPNCREQFKASIDTDCKLDYKCKVAVDGVTRKRCGQYVNCPFNYLPKKMLWLSTCSAKCTRPFF